MTDYQQKQIDVIDEIEKQVKAHALKFTTVSPVVDFENDLRICLTCVHIPSNSLKSKIEESIIAPLKKSFPEYYYYPASSLHMTIKSVRVINNPPHFNSDDIEKAKQVFATVVPTHLKFKAYFYRLLLFPNNLALIGTTDPELDKIVLELDKKLKQAGVPDDKQYTNAQYFFSNLTLARFSNPTQEFIDKVEELSKNIHLEPYTIDSASLVTCNAAFKKLQIVQTWELR